MTTFSPVFLPPFVLTKGLWFSQGKTGTGKTSLLHFVADSLEETAYSILFHAAPPTLEPLLWSPLSSLVLRVDGLMATVLKESACHYEHGRLLGKRSPFSLTKRRISTGSFACLATILASENSQGKLLQVVLFGTSELNGILAQPELQPLQRHLAVMLRLAPFAVEEVELFIRHRLRVAGWTGPDLFSPGAIQKITEHSDAIPSRIKALCHGALVVASPGSSQPFLLLLLKRLHKPRRNN
jgi:hypothetical protein